MNPKKTGINKDMPSKVLRNCKDSWAPFLKGFSLILSGVFSETLKQADIIPIFKKKDSFKKKNYRRVWFQ